MYRSFNFIPSIHSELQRMSDDENLKCSICHHDYAVKRRDPRLLRCLHALCEPCLKKHKEADSITCQICQTVDAVKDDKPIDVVRLNEVILHMAKHSPERLLCTNKADGRKGKMYCFECNHFLCDQCESFHSQLEATNNHLSVYLGDLMSHPLTEWQTKRKCQFHPDYPVCFFCPEESSRKLICLYCVMKDHPGQKTLEIDEAYDIEKEKLKNLSNRLSSMIEAKKDLMSKQNDVEVQRKRVRETFDKIRSVVSQRQRHHQQILNYHYGEFQQSFDENTRLLRKQLADIRGYYDQSMAFHSDPTYKALEQSAYKTTDVSVPKSPDSDLFFVQVGLANLLQDIQTFGKVKEVCQESSC